MIRWFRRFWAMHKLLDAATHLQRTWPLEIQKDLEVQFDALEILVEAMGEL